MQGEHMGMGNEKGEHHPEIHKAQMHLNQARETLEQSTHHYGGHRQKAIELIKQAQEELKQGVQYANQHRDANGGGM